MWSSNSSAVSPWGSRNPTPSPRAIIWIRILRSRWVFPDPLAPMIYECWAGSRVKRIRFSSRYTQAAHRYQGELEKGHGEWEAANLLNKAKASEIIRSPLRLSFNHAPDGARSKGLTAPNKWDSY